MPPPAFRFPSCAQTPPVHPTPPAAAAKSRFPHPHGAPISPPPHRAWLPAEARWGWSKEAPESQQRVAGAPRTANAEKKLKKKVRMLVCSSPPCCPPPPLLPQPALSSRHASSQLNEHTMRQLLHLICVHFCLPPCLFVCPVCANNRGNTQTVVRHPCPPLPLPLPHACAFSTPPVPLPFVQLSEHEKALKEFKCEACRNLLCNPLRTPCGESSL